MGVFSKLIVASLMGFNSVESRRYLDDPEGFERITVEDAYDEDVQRSLGTRQSPIVEASDCSKEMCLFSDDYNKWCWRFQSPTLEVGWAWKQ